MFNKFLKDKFYCGVDIGTKKIKAGILKIDNSSEMELIGAFEHACHGFKDNSVSNLAEFSECLHHTIFELTKRTGVRVRQVQLGVGGAMIETRRMQTAIPLIDRGNKVITSRDVSKINANARLLGLKIEEEILHDLPQVYRIDDSNPALDPVGLCGRKLGLEALMIVINGNRIRNITKAVHQAGYDVANVFFSTYATSRALLEDAQRKGGCALVDIGSGLTSVLIFYDGVLCGLHRIDGGGDDLTRRIAEVVDLPLSLAEEIKQSYAVASGDDEHGEEEILVKKEDAYLPVRRGAVSRAIRPEIEGLVERIRDAINGSGVKDKLACGMVMTGGGSLLSGIIEHVSQQVNMPAQLGQVNLPLRKSLHHTAMFSSVVGLGLGGYEKSFRFSAFAHNGEPWMKTLVGRARDLYQEYF